MKKMCYGLMLALLIIGAGCGDTGRALQSVQKVFPEGRVYSTSDCPLLRPWCFLVVTSNQVLMVRTFGLDPLTSCKELKDIRDVYSFPVYSEKKTFVKRMVSQYAIVEE